MLLVGAIALFIACIGKSGQFPLHTWLPDAMAGPTPVSSLLHSSTMVVAGVFLVARIYPVFWEGFNIGQGGMSFIAIIGAITIVIAALLAFVQDDIKKVLAYSTVSQLGYMMLGLGTGAWLAAVFHIFTHAMFKCCLFLCAGSISHSGSHHSFDMKKDMGGLRKFMPITFVAWIVSTLALTGVFPFAGFWSKDEIIDNVGHAGYDLFYWTALGGAALTAMYMTRATYLTFFGEPRGAAAGEHHPDEEHAEEHEMETLTVGARTLSSAANTGHGSGDDSHGDEHHDTHHSDGPHESGPILLTPIVILAVLSALVGLLNATAFGSDWERFKTYVEPRPTAVVIEDYLVATGPGESIQLANPMVFVDAVGAEAGQRGRRRPLDRLWLRDPGTGHRLLLPGGRSRRAPAQQDPPLARHRRRRLRRGHRVLRLVLRPQEQAARRTDRAVEDRPAAAISSSRTSTTSTRCTRVSSFEPSPIRSPRARTGSTRT